MGGHGEILKNERLMVSFRPMLRVVVEIFLKWTLEGAFLSYVKGGCEDFFKWTLMVDLRAILREHLKNGS